MAPSRIADHVGRVLNGRYRLVAPIGTGASAHVFLGEDTSLRRPVAIKVLHAALADDESFLRRFRAEAQAVGALNHANIVRVFDWGEDRDGPFLVLEHLGGGSLRDMLDGGHLLTPSQALVVGLEAARALDYAHRRGLVHRDIKPANLLFDDEGRLCIADFGLARALAEAAWTEPAGAVLGTARYASPEQAQGSSVDGRADVYALALVLVESVTGRVPFAADTTIATLMGRVGAQLDAPAELGPLGPAIEAAAAPAPADRPDAAGLVKLLDRASGDLPAPTPLPLEPPDLDGLAAAASRPRAAVRDDITEIGVRPALYDREGEPTGPTGTAPVAAPRRWPRRLLIAALFPIVAALLAGAVLGLTKLNRPSHPVPTLVGEPIDAALRQAHQLHFTLRQSHRFGAVSDAKGVVLEQRPGAGTLKEGAHIDVVVSDGPPPVQVPDLTGQTEDQAQQVLTAAGLKATVTREDNLTVKKGLVLDWSPRGEQARGTEIIVRVSDGPPQKPIPDLKGKTADDATATLKGLGFNVTVVQVFSDTTPDKQVDSTVPAAGTSAAVGTTVTVNVSKGPELVPVPQLSGLSEQAAAAKLQSVGLTEGNRYGPPGRPVFSSDPVAGTNVKKGTAVNLYTR